MWYVLRHCRCESPSAYAVTEDPIQYFGTRQEAENLAAKLRVSCSSKTTYSVEHDNVIDPNDLV